MAPEKFYAGFLEAWGFNAPTSIKANEKMQRAMRTSQRERPPWEAKIPVERLARAPFPKFVVSGGWKNAPALAREIGGSAFKAICDLLERELRAERVVFDEAAHNPQLLGKPFNARLDVFLQATSGT